MKRVLILIVVLGVLVFAYYTISPLWRNIAMDEASPFVPASEMIEDPGEGNGQGTDGVRTEAELVPKAHDVEGRVQVLKVGDEQFLRFEDLKTINGPDLHIYLATDTSAKEIIDLGNIKATEGNVNYELPPGTDLETYDTVLIWCKAFSVLFSYAEFTEFSNFVE